MRTFIRSSVTAFQTLGERLQRHRDQRHLTVEDVSRETGIPKKYVLALEAGAYQSLPGEAYVRHFLKQYADLLGVKADSVFPLYERERTIVSTPDHTVKPPNALAKVRTFHVGLAVRRSLLAIVVPLLLVYLGMKLFAFLSPPALSVTSPVDNATITGTIARIEGGSEPGAVVQVNGQEVFLDANGSFIEEVDLRPGLNAIRVSATNTRGKERVITRNIFSQTQEDARGRDMVQ